MNSSFALAKELRMKLLSRIWSQGSLRLKLCTLLFILAGVVGLGRALLFTHPAHADAPSWQCNQTSDGRLQACIIYDNGYIVTGYQITDCNIEDNSAALALIKDGIGVVKSQSPLPCGSGT